MSIRGFFIALGLWVLCGSLFVAASLTFPSIMETSKGTVFTPRLFTELAMSAILVGSLYLSIWIEIKLNAR